MFLKNYPLCGIKIIRRKTTTENSKRFKPVLKQLLFKHFAFIHSIMNTLHKLHVKLCLDASETDIYTARYIFYSCRSICQNLFLIVRQCTFGTSSQRGAQMMTVNIRNECSWRSAMATSTIH